MARSIIGYFYLHKSLNKFCNINYFVLTANYLQRSFIKFVKGLSINECMDGLENSGR